MDLPLYHVDAFTDSVFGGNPAAVVPLSHWLDDQLLQRIAAENNLSETAFFVGENGRYQLRWFTPTDEIDLCGHATLATAYIIGRFLQPNASRLTFDTRSGDLPVDVRGEEIVLDFPSRPGKPEEISDRVVALLGARPVALYRARDLIAVFENEEQVRAFQPDPERLKELPGLGVAVTAPGTSCDFVSRAFFPKIGIPEDPVTGATHCTLIPYWSKRLGKSSLLANQLSSRGGQLRCVDRGARVEIGGRAVLYFEGKMHLMPQATRPTC